MSSGDQQNLELMTLVAYRGGRVGLCSFLLDDCRNWQIKVRLICDFWGSIQIPIYGSKKRSDNNIYAVLFFLVIVPEMRW